MPVIDKIVEEPSTHIIEPIAEQVCRKLLMNIGAYDLFKDNLYIKNDRTAVSHTADDNHRAKVIVNHCEITIDESMSHLDTKWGRSNFRHFFGYPISKEQVAEEFPIFADPVANIYLYTKRVPCDLTLDVSMRVRDKNVADRLFDAINIFNSVQMNIEHYNVAYDFPLSSDILFALHRLYKYKTSLKMTFPEYMNTGTRGGISVTKSVHNKSSEVVIRVSECNIIGNGDVSQKKPEAIMDDDSVSHYIVQFSYEVQFMRPMYQILNFPCIVENQLVSNELIFPTKSHINVTYAGIVDNAVAGYTQGNAIHQSLIFRSPFYDDWEIPITHPVGSKKSYRPIAICCFTLDPEETVLNIESTFKDGLQSPLHPTVINILKEQGVLDSTHGGGIFKVLVFANDKELLPDMYEFTEDLTLTVKSTDVYKIYRLVIVEALDIKDVSKDSRKLVLKYRSYFPAYLMWHTNFLQSTGQLVTIRDRILDTIDWLIRTKKIFVYIESALERKITHKDIWDYLTSAEQFLFYVIERNIYDDFVQWLLTLGYIYPSDQKSPETYYPGNQIVIREGAQSYGYHSPERVIASRVGIQSSK